MAYDLTLQSMNGCAQSIIFGGLLTGICGTVTCKYGSNTRTQMVGATGDENRT